MNRRLAALSSVLTVAATVFVLLGAPAARARADEGLDRRGAAWVEKQIRGMSLEHRVAQLLMIQVTGRHHHPRDPEFARTRSQVRDLGVGGVIVSTSNVHGIPALLEALDSEAELPLIVASDLERSLAFRVRDGVVPAPRAMAVGATGSEDAARFLGALTAREGRALGIHWTFAPVADVNSNPRNPVINLRSFGEDPALVARMSAAFIEGARAGGMMTTAKHFPGHGDTAVDSHFGLPTITADRARLETLEWTPFRAAIEAGVESVMVAHVSMPAIDPSGLPATLSPLLTESLLRGEMGFEGLIVTDAMDMEGVAGVWVGKAAVMAILAGADLVLMPPDVRVAHQSIVRAVREGRIDPARIESSVRRVLAAKARLGLHLKAHRLAAPRFEDVARPEDVARASEIAAEAITLVRNDGDVLPLAAEDDLDILHLVIGHDVRWPVTGRTVREGLAARDIGHETRILGREIAPSTAESVLERARSASHVVLSVYAWVPRSPDVPSLDPSIGELVDALAASGSPVVMVSFLNPYLLVEHPSIPVYLATYGRSEAAEKAAVAALFGEHAIAGRLPVGLPGFARAGHGIEVPRRVMALDPDREEGPRLPAVDRLLEGFIEEGAFPGAVAAVGHRGRLVHLGAYGRQTYEASSPPVDIDTIYDVASLTKVIATTTMAMILVDEGRLDLDLPVREFLPRFQGEGKDAVTVRHLLTHGAGVDWWAPLFESLEGPDAYLDHIRAMPLVDAPGAKTLYSDLGLILLGEVLERVAGESLDTFVRKRVFEPLGMKDTMFRPPALLLDRIAPTEIDASWRKRLLHGEVHDENAHALGGVAPHAGLFGTATDLARFAQMMLWRGVYDHRRVVERSTIDRFVRRAEIVEGSSRALGWDTKSAEGSSAGTLFGPRSFGHTGFTGTSIWIDPDRQLFIVLLTNRVHPSRDNNAIRRVRPAFADAVVRALADTLQTVRHGGNAEAKNDP